MQKYFFNNNQIWLISILSILIWTLAYTDMKEHIMGHLLMAGLYATGLYATGLYATGLYATGLYATRLCTTRLCTGKKIDVVNVGRIGLH